MMSLGVCCVVDVAAVAAGIVVASAVPCAHTRFACSAPAVIQVLASKRVVTLISWSQVQVTRARRPGRACTYCGLSGGAVSPRPFLRVPALSLFHSQARECFPRLIWLA